MTLELVRTECGSIAGQSWTQVGSGLRKFIRISQTRAAPTRLDGSQQAGPTRPEVLKNLSGKGGVRAASVGEARRVGWPRVRRGRGKTCKKWGFAPLGLKSMRILGQFLLDFCPAAGAGERARCARIEAGSWEMGPSRGKRVGSSISSVKEQSRGGYFVGRKAK